MTKFLTFKVSTKRISDKAIIKTQYVSIPAISYNTPLQTAQAIYKAMELSGVKVQTVFGMGGGYNIGFECSKKDDKRYLCEVIPTATVELNVPMQRIADMLVSVMEGGYSPWIHKATPVDNKSGGHEWYSKGQRLDSVDDLFTLEYDKADEGEGENTGRMVITRQKLVWGPQLMAMNSPGAFGDMVGENDDALTADIFMQYVVLGEVVYG